METIRLAEHELPHQIDVPGGHSAVIDRSGRVTVNLSSPHSLRSVGIADLAQVVCHYVNTIAGSVSHHLSFKNGGELKYVFNTAGELVMFEGKGLIVSMNEHGTAMVIADPEYVSL